MRSYWENGRSEKRLQKGVCFSVKAAQSWKTTQGLHWGDAATAVGTPGVPKLEEARKGPLEALEGAMALLML